VDAKKADAAKSDTLRNPTPPHLMAPHIMGNEAWLHAASEREQFVIVERACEKVSSSIAQTLDL